MWPNSEAGATTDWIEFVAETHDPGPEDYPLTKYRVNVSFLKSNWKCQFGNCPGVLITGAMTDVSCCQIGVHIEQGKEMTRVRKAVAQLTAEDMDNYEAVLDGSWYYKTGSRKQRKQEAAWTGEGPEPMFHTAIAKDGAGCIFANRHGGSAGKPGCALHILADRLGVHHSETKPDICWQIPFSVIRDLDDQEEMNITKITGTHASIWGADDTSDPEALGYWCTETPDAYNGDQEVYQYAAQELRVLMGDPAYELMAAKLSTIERRYPMPGETANGGRRMLPLLVANRTAQWKEHRMSDALDRSAGYLSKESS